MICSRIAFDVGLRGRRGNVLLRPISLPAGIGVPR
jgi:hypothetical protein